MTTSLQIAQECLKDGDQSDEETIPQQTFDGLQSFAQTIESGNIVILLKIFHYVRLSNITLMEGLEIRISQIFWL